MTSTARTAYCTILATNYLPKALVLADSLRRHHGVELAIVLIDAETDADLPHVDGDFDLRSLQVLGLERDELHGLAMSYELVEFATAIKPVLLQRLLETHEQAAYLDPDTYVVAPLEELPVDLAASPGGILLTPHFLAPPPADAFLSDGHLLMVGVFNLGFLAVDRRASGFLAWWWEHLQRECVVDPLSGLFVDQKWLDIGSVYFHGEAWQHPGYNVSIANLHERALRRRPEGIVLGPQERPLRLFHFHAFDPDRPEELSTRFDTSTAGFTERDDTLRALCVEYAEQVLAYRRALPPPPDYRFYVDHRGRHLGRQIRRAYRLATNAGHRPPSPFDAAQAQAYEAWRRGAWSTVGREMTGDMAKAARATVPAPVFWVQRHLPGLSQGLRKRVVSRSGMWS